MATTEGNMKKKAGIYYTPQSVLAAIPYKVFEPDFCSGDFLSEAVKAIIGNPPFRNSERVASSNKQVYLTWPPQLGGWCRFKLHSGFFMVCKLWKKIIHHINKALRPGE
jgi:hypothetical protein